MVQVAAIDGNVELAEAWHQQLKEDGFTPDAGLYALLIQACQKAKEPEKAVAYFNLMVSAGVKPTSGAYVHIILTLAQARDVEVVSEWMERMLEAGFEPTIECYEAVLQATASRRDRDLQDFWEDFWLKQLAKRKKKPDREVYKVLIRVPAMYGDVKRAIQQLEKMRKAHQEPGPNEWNYVLKACEKAKDADNAQKYMNRMRSMTKGAKPNEESYHLVIKTCAKAGKPKLATKWRNRMAAAGFSVQRIQFDEVIKASASSATISADYAAEWETVKVRREVFAAALRRLDAQLAQARRNTEALEERSCEYRELRRVLAELPEKVSHPIMVPFGPLASFPGQLVHTNEVLCQLSSEYFALRTTGNALAMVDRRLRRLEEEQASAARELRDLSLRRKLASGELSAEPGSAGSGSVGKETDVAGATVSVDENGFLDIREPLEEEQPAESQSSVPAEEDAWKFWQSPAKNKADTTLSRLRELEQMEECESGQDPAPYEDELSELDRIMDSYAHLAPAEAEGPSDSSPPRSPKPQAPQQKPPAKASSPADLFRLMESVAQSEPSTYPPGPPGPPQPPGAPGPSGALEQAGVSELVREHSQSESRHDPDSAPKRVSKFKVAQALEAGRVPSMQAYQSVIQAYLDEKQTETARQWLQWMKGNGTKPDESIYSMFIRTDARKVGDWLEEMESEGVVASAESYTAAIRHFASLGSKKGVKQAAFWFDRMLLAGVSPTQDAYTQMITAHARAGQNDEAGQWLSKLTAAGFRPNLSAYTALMQGYLRVQDATGVQQILDWLVLEGLDPSRRAYNIAIRAFSEAGDAKAAEQMYKRLTVAGRYPDQKTFLSLIQCHTRLRNFDRARAWFKEMLTMNVRPNFAIYAAMIRGAAVADRPDDAREFLEEMALRKFHHSIDRRDWEAMMVPALRCFEKEGDDDSLVRWTEYSADQGFPDLLPDTKVDFPEKRPYARKRAKKAPAPKVREAVADVESELKALEALKAEGKTPSIWDFNKVMKAFALSPEPRFSMARAFLMNTIVPVTQPNEITWTLLLRYVACGCEKAPTLAPRPSILGGPAPTTAPATASRKDFHDSPPGLEVQFPRLEGGLVGALFAALFEADPSIHPSNSQGSASSTGPILLAAEGLVFNVASARNLYGPGGKYAALSGRDASRMLGKNSLEEEDAASQQLPLNLAERAFLSAWVMSFKNKYPIVGRLQEEEQEEATPAALIKAAELGDLGRLRRQLAQGADVRWADADGLTALHWAARAGQPAAVDALLAAGAEAEGRDLKGRTGLHWAASQGHAAVAERLLEKTDPEASAADAWLPLHFAAQGGHVEVIQALLRRGADVNRTSKAGVTALMGAARSGHLGATRVLLESGADTGTRANGKTAQQWAANQGLNDIAELIASFSPCDGKRGVFTPTWPTWAEGLQPSVLVCSADRLESMAEMKVNLSRRHISIVLRLLFKDYRSKKVETLEPLLDKILACLVPRKNPKKISDTYNRIVWELADAGEPDMAKQWVERLRADGYELQAVQCAKLAQAYFANGDGVSALWWLQNGLPRGTTLRRNLGLFVDTVATKGKKAGAGVGVVVKSSRPNYGFIKLDEPPFKLYFRRAETAGFDDKMPAVGTRVRFDVVLDRDDRKLAANIVPFDAIFPIGPKTCLYAS
ncbi:unnamed protein product [Symbiodinium natans]|uniref:PROP1-like PPR domain-containing protein n=1 Tax=Symbiodinium natans TaxID=878477 RepID=A0A812UIW3_9DINO|nr:unnamed protein product [Symbiodinium natans]